MIIYEIAASWDRVKLSLGPTGRALPFSSIHALEYMKILKMHENLVKSIIIYEIASQLESSKAFFKAHRWGLTVFKHPWEYMKIYENV